MSDRTGSSSFGFGHAESDELSWGGGGVHLNSPNQVQTQRGRIVSERNFYRNSVHSQRDSFYDAAIGFNPMPPGMQDYGMSQRSSHHHQHHYSHRNHDNRPRSGVNVTTNTSHHIPWSPPPGNNRPHSGSMAQFYDPFVHSDNLVRRLVAERDAIMHEYSTVMSERDKVHEEMDRLSSELSSSKNRIEEMELVVQNKSAEVSRLVSEVASVKLLYWNLAENLDELKATMLHQISTVEDVASLASMQDVISRQMDTFISENSAIGRRRSRSRNNSGFGSLTLRGGRNLPRFHRRSSSSQDEHERSLLDLLQVTDQNAHSSFRESRDRNDAFDTLNVFNGGPALNGFTLFMERIRNLRQELMERNFEISSNANEISSLKGSLNNYRSENSSLLLEIEKLRGENLKMRGNMAKFPKVEFVQVPGSAFNEQKFTLKVGFYQNTEFNWSNFGVMLSDITGSLTVIEVKPTSVFHKLLKPKMKLRSIGNQSVKSWQDMHAKLSNRSVSYLFTFVQSLGRSRSDKAVQTEKVSEVREQLSRKTSSVVRPVSGFEPSPFTRNSTLRSPLAKNSSETLNRCRGTSGLSDLHRKRHRSYSPSIDLNWLSSCSPFMSSPVFHCDSRRHRTLPRNRTELDWLSKRRSEPFRTTDESLIDGREPATNGTLSEENSDNMFEEALMELDEQNNSTEMQIMEDLESIFSSGPESSGIASPVKTPETAFDRKLTFTNFAGPSQNVNENLKVAHKHVASEPLQTEEKSTQAEDVENENAETDKDDGKKQLSELTWPRMRQNVLNIKSSDFSSRNENAHPVVATIRGDDKGKGSPRSVRIPFMKDGKKRTSIMGFKFSPAASLRSKNSSKCSNSSRYRSPNESCEDNGSSLSPTPSRQSFTVSSRKHSEGERPKKTSPINRSNSMSCEATSSVVFECCEPVGRIVLPSSGHVCKSPFLDRFKGSVESSACHGLTGRNSHLSSRAFRDQEDHKRLISLTRANVSQGFGFCFAGGNLWGLFVTKVTPTLSQLLQVGDKILEINGIGAVEATFEEFIILLKTYPGLEITLLVEEKLAAYRDMEANHSLRRDKFYVRVADVCSDLNGNSDNSSHGLKLKRGDVIWVRDSMHSGRIGTWYASKVDERNIDLVENSGTVHSMYHGVLVLLNQKSMNDKNRHLTSLDVISEEDKRSHSGSHTTVGSFRRFFMKRIGSNSSFSGVNSTSASTGSDLNPLGSSVMNLTDIGGPHIYEFQRVKYFDSNFQRPVVFVGILSEALIAFFARTYQKRFKIIDFSKLEESGNIEDDDESLHDDSLTGSFNRGQVKSFKAICSELPKGSHALIACDTNQLKLLYELGMHPLVFAYDPHDNQKSVKDIYFWLTEGRSLASKKAKRLIVRSRSVHNELKKMKLFWGKLSGSLSEVEGMVVKQTEQISNFNLFIDEQPNELRVALNKQVADYVNSRE